MNFVNAFVTCMILGVGIDYGIHIIHRITQEGLDNPTGLLETGKAVVMAALDERRRLRDHRPVELPRLKSMGIVCGHRLGHLPADGADDAPRDAHRDQDARHAARTGGLIGAR
jgi:hypothetical protein